MKGLRLITKHSESWKSFVNWNWPDLWRDCDYFWTHAARNIPNSNWNWPDLWRDCDKFLKTVSFLNRIFLLKLTWSMKGLRLSISTTITYICFINWNWPDLWRDCDASSWAFKQLQYSIEIDLIYEGIATNIATSTSRATTEFYWNWPDLWRDCDVSKYQEQ